MIQILWSPEGCEDFLQSIQYLAERNPAAAAKFVERVDTVLQMLALGNVDGPEQRLHSGKVVHSWPVYPYRVYYERHDALIVLRVYHQRRRPIVELVTGLD